MALGRLLWIWSMALLAVSVAATVYNVGDSAGWTTRVPVDYGKWASSNKFHVGDSIVFSYNKTFHNVMQVSKQQYDSCSSSSPAATYNSGADSIALKRPGTFYFLCGFSGHCQQGQKVEIKVIQGSSVPGPSPSPSPRPPPTAGSALPSAPPPSAASKTTHLRRLSLLAYVAAFYCLSI